MKKKLLVFVLCMMYIFFMLQLIRTSRVMKDTHQDKLAQKIYIAYKDNLKAGKEKDELEALKEKVIDCCKNEDLVSCQQYFNVKYFSCQILGQML